MVLRMHSIHCISEQIEKLKANFWEKNHKSIEATATEYIKWKVKKMVAADVSNFVSRSLSPGRFSNLCLQVKRLHKRYREYVENNDRANQGLRAVMDVSNPVAEDARMLGR